MSLLGEQLVLGCVPWLRSLLSTLLRQLKGDPMAAFVLATFLDPLDLGHVNLRGPGADGSILADAELKRAENVLDRFWAKHEAGIVGRLGADLGLPQNVVEQARQLERRREEKQQLRQQAILSSGAPKTRALLAYLQRPGTSRSTRVPP